MIDPRLPFVEANVTRQDIRPRKALIHGDSLYTLQDFQVRIPITVVGLKKNIPVELNFENKLSFDCLARGLTADIANDDGNALQDVENNNYRFSYVQTIVQTLDKDTKQVIRTINIYISSYPNYLNEMILSPDYLYGIRVNQDVNSIVFSCEPLKQENPIIFYPNPVS